MKLPITNVYLAFPLFCLKPILFLIVGAFLSINSYSQTTIQITEIYANDVFKLKNTTTQTIDISTYWICNFPLYEQLGTLSTSCGDLQLAGGEEIVFNITNFFGASEGELGLYTTNNFANPAAIISYAEWGLTGHERSSVAVAKGIWDGNAAPAFSNGQSIAVNGLGTQATDWFINNQPQTCGSNCSATLSVNNTPIPSGIYQASNQILSTGTVAANSTVRFEATNEITLSATFSVESGATFEATIGEGCTTSFKKTSSLPKE